MEMPSRLCCLKLSYCQEYIFINLFMYLFPLRLMVQAQMKKNKRSVLSANHIFAKNRFTLTPPHSSVSHSWDTKQKMVPFWLLTGGSLCKLIMPIINHLSAMLRFFHVACKDLSVSLAAIKTWMEGIILWMTCSNLAFVTFWQAVLLPRRQVLACRVVDSNLGSIIFSC